HQVEGEQTGARVLAADHLGKRLETHATFSICARPFEAMPGAEVWASCGRRFFPALACWPRPANASRPAFSVSGTLLLRSPAGEDLGAGRRPHAATAPHEIKDPLDGGNAMRHAADPWSQGQSHDSPAAGCRLAIEQLEVVHHLLDELRWLVFIEMKYLQVAD